MGDYFGTFDPKSQGSRKLINESVPLVAHQETWQIVDSPERLSKRFEFSDRPRMVDFINELLVYEDQVNHHAMVRFDHLSVDVEVYTKDINRVTNLDREFVKSIDEIYEDVKNYSYRQESNPSFA